MNAVDVSFERTSTSADAIQRAAYRFTNRFGLELHTEPTEFRCVLKSVDPLDDVLVTSFRVEVLDQVLRERIRMETEGVRNLILSAAFSHLDAPDQ